MNLKEQITRTENLEIKLQKEMTNINNVIVRGGGVQSTSVAEVAENIRNMLGQYKKIAIIDFSPTTSVKLNINFNPTKFIIILKNIRNGDCVAIDSNLGFKLTLVNLRVDIKSTDIKYNNDTKVLTLDPERFNLYDFVMERVIAIE